MTSEEIIIERVPIARDSSFFLVGIIKCIIQW